MIGFIGTGNMGSCLIRVFASLSKKSKTEQEKIIIYDKKPSSKLPQSITTAKDLKELMNSSEKIFICVKPKDFPALAETMKLNLTATQTIISVMAGVSLKELGDRLENKTSKLVRIMPNTPTLVSQGAGGISFSADLAESEKEWIEKRFNQIGYYLTIPENLMHIVTAISGSGPAYMFMILEAMSDAGVQFGLPRDEATQLAAQTMLGSATLLLKSHLHPMELKNQVTSPGGITIEALSSLEKNRLPHSIIQGVKSAYQKSIEMSSNPDA